ncbi:MAG: Coenzyme F420 hydrogenase/dehydrogenase, beta subunit C-terminal domain [Clostridia bacterium]|nr:Coenzyme F420 hydrogenase/dehydrogenase, beta subunit C-terminal domain [Clostridia bacterium]
MKKRVAIITLDCYNNFGNRLQNYALRETIKALGLDADCLFDQRYAAYQPIRKFQTFSEKHIQEIKYDITNNENWAKFNAKYDYFVVGSDQVWAPHFTSVTSVLPLFFLQFAPKGKRVAYAASFGMPEIPAELRAKYSIGLLGMNRISLREKSGAAIVQNLCALDAPVLPDPSLLLDKEKWLSIARPHAGKPKKPYMAVNYVIQGAEGDIKYIQALAAKLGLAIVDLNALAMKNEIGPAEYLDYVNDAALVCTDSFHNCAFSILFHKPFVVFTSHNERVSTRIDSLLETYGLMDRRFSQFREEKVYDVDFTKADETLRTERSRAIAYLREALGLEDAGLQPGAIVEKAQCTGCTACFNACPNGCITMQADAEGFLYPHIDEESCIHCDLCREACPSLYQRALPKEKTRAFACRNKDEATRLASSSGGVFSLLSQNTVANGGVVFGAIYDEDFSVKHAYAESAEALWRFRGSKYTQSRIGTAYRDAKAFLETGREVLFSGTACQIAGLLQYLGKAYGNLTCVDVVCYGTPSPLAWKQYLAYREAAAGARLTSVNLRCKENGWHGYNVKYEFENGSVYCSTAMDDPYIYAFMANDTLRRSCFACHYKTTDRMADLTMADFWGVEGVMPELDDNKGTSLVLVHSEKGLKLLQALRDRMDCRETELQAALKANPLATSCAPVGAQRMNLACELEKGRLCTENAF